MSGSNLAFTTNCGAHLNVAINFKYDAAPTKINNTNLLPMKTEGDKVRKLIPGGRARDAEW